MLPMPRPRWRVRAAGDPPQIQTRGWSATQALLLGSLPILPVAPSPIALKTGSGTENHTSPLSGLGWNPCKPSPSLSVAFTLSTPQLASLCPAKCPSECGGHRLPDAQTSSLGTT